MAASISSGIKSVVWEKDSSGTIFRTKKKNDSVFKTEYEYGEILETGTTSAALELKPKDPRHKTKVVKVFFQTTIPRQLSIYQQEKKACAFLKNNCPSFKHYIKSTDLPNAVILRYLSVTLSQLNSKLSFWEKILMLDQLAIQIREMHSAGVVHGDIHRRNIMYDHFKNRYYFIDFGFARLKEDDPSSFEFLKSNDNTFFYSVVKKCLQSHFDEEIFNQNTEMLQAVKEIYENQGSADVKSKIESFISKYGYLFHDCD
jgi:tRNA A-37 threonylcarbamoyl transferase component Bud32